MAGQFDASVYTRLSGSDEFGVLLRVVDAITRQEISSPAVLLGSFQGTAEFDRLCELAEKEPLLGVADLPEEYAGIVNKLIRHLESKSIQDVIDEFKSRGLQNLSQAERDLWRNLTRDAAQSRR